MRERRQLIITTEKFMEISMSAAANHSSGIPIALAESVAGTGSRNRWSDRIAELSDVGRDHFATAMAKVEAEHFDIQSLPSSESDPLWIDIRNACTLSLVELSVLKNIRTSSRG
jgi:hypothetical protein